MHLNDSSSIAIHLKNHSIPKSKFQKILVENTTIIAYKIDKLQLQFLDWLNPRLQDHWQILYLEQWPSQYIYKVIHRQTVSLYHNSLVWLDMWDSLSWDQNLGDLYASRRFYHIVRRKLV